MIEEMIGKEVTVRIMPFSPYSDKIYKGILQDVDDNFIKIKYEEKKSKYTKCINKKYISEIYTVE